MYLTRKVKLNIRVIGAFGIQEPFALCQVHQVAILIGSNIVRFEAGETHPAFWGQCW